MTKPYFIRFIIKHHINSDIKDSIILQLTEEDLNIYKIKTLIKEKKSFNQEYRVDILIIKRL